MKTKLLSLLLLGSSLAVAADLTPAVRATPTRVDSVTVEDVGQRGFPVTHVTVRATFQNKCWIPQPGELVEISDYRDNYRTLTITLGRLPSQRLCSAVSAPEAVTIDLGNHVKPNDGRFARVVVNGVQAQ